MRVGTRCDGFGFVPCLRDHPHACGDKTLNRAENNHMPGSSPCVWGQVLNAPENCIVLRIIPMRVGTRQE